MLRKIIRTILPFEDFLYILQQEEYSIQRINFWFFRFFFKRNIAKRDYLKFTQRIYVTLLTSISLWLFSSIVLIIYTNQKIILSFALLINILLIPIYTIIANLIIGPFYELIKSKIIKQASLIMEKKKGQMKIIAITGSFGKTTLKNFLEQMLKYHFRVQMVPGNINSAIGIASFIKKELDKNTEILITEIDSYKKNRIAKAVKMLSPDYVVITNIKDQHLERYKNRENLAKSLFEIFQFAPKNSIKITNKETGNYLKSINLNTDGNLFLIDEEKVKDKDVFDQNFAIAKFICKKLGVEDKYIDYLKDNLKIPERRGVLKEMFGFEFIDNSYNINLDTAQKTIEDSFKLAKSKNKELVVITAGIPELSYENKDSNNKLGQFIEKYSQKAFILDSIFSKDIVSGFKDKNKFQLCENINDTFEKIKYLEKEKYLFLLTPELTDLYY